MIMSRLIRLTNIVLNTNCIHTIKIQPNKYIIRLTNKEWFGHIGLCYGSGYGMVSTDNTQVEVCETNHPIDYKIVTEWLNKIE